MKFCLKKPFVQWETIIFQFSERSKSFVLSSIFFWTIAFTKNLVRSQKRCQPLGKARLNHSLLYHWEQMCTKRGLWGSTPPPRPCLVISMDSREFSGPNGCWAPLLEQMRFWKKIPTICASQTLMTPGCYFWDLLMTNLPDNSKLNHLENQLKKI